MLNKKGKYLNEDIYATLIGGTVEKKPIILYSLFFKILPFMCNQRVSESYLYKQNNKITHML